MSGFAAALLIQGAVEAFYRSENYGVSLIIVSAIVAFYGVYVEPTPALFRPDKDHRSA